MSGRTGGCESSSGWFFVTPDDQRLTGPTLWTTFKAALEQQALLAKTHRNQESRSMWPENCIQYCHHVAYPASPASWQPKDSCWKATPPFHVFMVWCRVQRDKENHVPEWTPSPVTLVQTSMPSTNPRRSQQTADWRLQGCDTDTHRNASHRA
jgi:hypothetical protein